MFPHGHKIIYKRPRASYKTLVKWLNLSCYVTRFTCIFDLVIQVYPRLSELVRTCTCSDKRGQIFSPYDMILGLQPLSNSFFCAARFCAVWRCFIKLLIHRHTYRHIYTQFDVTNYITCIFGNRNRFLPNQIVTANHQQPPSICLFSVRYQSSCRLCHKHLFALLVLRPTIIIS